MATFYVPVERRNLPATDVSRWFILVMEAADPVTALTEACRQVRDEMRLRSTSVWAAVRDIPDFAYMQALRTGFDASRGMSPKRREAAILASVAALA